MTWDMFGSLLKFKKEKNNSATEENVNMKKMKEKPQKKNKPDTWKEVHSETSIAYKMN